MLAVITLRMLMKKYWVAFCDIERNMWGSHRPTAAKWMLATLAVALCTWVGHDMYKLFGVVGAVSAFTTAMAFWFVGLPCVVYIIDNPK